VHTNIIFFSEKKIMCSEQKLYAQDMQGIITFNVDLYLREIYLNNTS